MSNIITPQIVRDTVEWAFERGDLIDCHSTSEGDHNQDLVLTIRVRLNPEKVEKAGGLWPRR